MSKLIIAAASFAIALSCAASAESESKDYAVVVNAVTINAENSSSAATSATVGGISRNSIPQGFGVGLRKKINENIGLEVGVKDIGQNYGYGYYADAFVKSELNEQFYVGAVVGYKGQASAEHEELNGFKAGLMTGFNFKKDFDLRLSVYPEGEYAVSSLEHVTTGVSASILKNVWKNNPSSTVSLSYAF
jgi:opacity protein-like surface antigen